MNIAITDMRRSVIRRTLIPMERVRSGSCYGNLPNDIGRIIFELVAEGQDYSCAYVSKQTQIWVERVMYRDIVLNTARRGELFHRTVSCLRDSKSATTKPRNFFETRVKSLVISFEVNPPYVLPILKACKAVKSLACFFSDGHISSELQAFVTSTALSPTWLSVPGSIFRPNERVFSHHIFRNLTHLEILWEDEEPELSWSSWEALSELKQLTHISVDIQFDTYQPAELARAILAWCPLTLRIFIVYVLFDYYFLEGSEQLEGLKSIHEGEVDPRAVVGCSQGLNNPDHHRCAIPNIHVEEFVYQWATVPLMGETMWGLAERRVEERRRNVKV
ncbi:hypothetical protein DFP72DRAFT_880466 [Ephemerocybe angulata]|uniref:Uncharacterized protein n=1 Tax=Ephemerocybe angulata TaxID=980116 RepID=A0A8H6IBH0_9AGAR|nr:hypothetical protein DFP72DRAFT_880466 [Tulosesus angulatus]